MTAEERIAELESELARVNEEARRETDAMFAQYQLSQLLASGGTPAELARALAAEVMRLCDALSVSVWLAEADGDAFVLAGQAGDPVGVPTRFESRDGAGAWALGTPGSHLIQVSAERLTGLVGMVRKQDAGLDPDGLRVVKLARHEIAVALGNAQLRNELEVERRELTAIIDGATDVIVQVGRDLRVVRINRAAMAFLGELASDSVGRTCAEVLQCARAGAHGEDACPLAEVLRTGEPIPIRDTTVVGHEGQVVSMVGGYAPIAIGSDEPRATAILRDVSGAKALQELREGFVATVSHELRTPLALVKGYAETLLHLELPESERLHYLERIDQLAERLRGLVTEILDVTHLHADPLVLERVPVQLSSLVARLVGDLEMTGGVERVRVDLPMSLPPVEVDAVRIGQVLENLVRNALKYSPESTTVTIAAEPTGAGWLTVHVEDEGVGVPERERSLVFEPFHRGRNVRESSIPGTGLGLAISRRIVEAHGGRLTLDSRPDGRPGTRVSFNLPVAGGRRRATGTTVPVSATTPGSGTITTRVGS
ncbi:MAG TPA: ATP-binding protein [Candidatus Limnocylindrales bacterium]